MITLDCIWQAKNHVKHGLSKINNLSILFVIKARRREYCKVWVRREIIPEQAIYRKFESSLTTHHPSNGDSVCSTNWCGSNPKLYLASKIDRARRKKIKICQILRVMQIIYA